MSTSEESIRTGDHQTQTLDVAALARQTLDRLQAFTHMNMLISTSRKTVIARAETLDAQLAEGRALPLHGFALVVKDNINTRDFPTTGGTPLLKWHRPATDAGVVQRLRTAGALVVGKANLHELAFGITSNNAHFGPVRNPYNSELIAGGSSGGTAAAVAAGIVPAGLGTDTGGSVRIPAALCGVCGFRPTSGRYPADGLILLSKTRDTIGIIARSVEDIQILDHTIAGAEPAHIAQIAGLRIGVPRNPFYEELHPEVEAVVENTLHTLAECGVELVELAVPGLLDLNDRIGFPIVLHEAPIHIQDYLGTLAIPISLEQLIEGIASPDVKRLFQAMCLGHPVDRAVYLHARDQLRPDLQKQFANLFRVHGLEAILYPTTPLTASRIGEDESVEINGVQKPIFQTYIRNCDPSANAGIPSLTIPAGLATSGLPVGVSLDGPAGSDCRLLALGAALQARLSPVPKPPAQLQP